MYTEAALLPLFHLGCLCFGQVSVNPTNDAVCVGDVLTLFLVFSSVC